VLDAIEEDDLVANAGHIGELLAQGLAAVRQKSQLVRDIRTRGLMIGIDLTRPVAALVKAECAARGLLIITVGDQMLRLLPPMVLTEAEAERGLGILSEVLADLEQE